MRMMRSKPSISTSEMGGTRGDGWLVRSDMALAPDHMARSRSNGTDERRSIVNQPLI